MKMARCLVLWLVCLPWVAWGQADARPELRVFTWPQYFDPQLLARFEQEYDVRVREVFYASDETKNGEFFASKQFEVDVIVSSGSALDIFVRLGALAPLTLDTSNELEDPIKGKQPELDGLAMPFHWGSLGVAYRKDLVPEPINSWAQVFQPEAALKNKIVMMEDASELFALALISQGHDANSEALSLIESTYAMLLGQQPFVLDYNYMDPTEAAGLIDGSVYVALQYNGDALVLKGFNDNIEYVVPDEGGILWVDYLALNARSERLALGQQFIEFFSRPEISAANSRYVLFASPFVKARDYLDENFVTNKDIYSDLDGRQLEIKASMSAAKRKRLNTMMFQLAN